MRSSDEGNRPRWAGQPGFFEIWFLVVFDPAAARAWWFRYTIFAPAPGQPGAPRATLWAAAFAAGASEPAIAVKRIMPIEVFDAGPSHLFAVRMGPSELTSGFARGEVEAGGHRIAWELRYPADGYAVERGPRLLRRRSLPVHVAHANSDLVCTGWVEVDGTRHVLRDAPGIQKHIWGTRRVEELFWLFCPRFAEDPRARLEASSARLRSTPGAGLAGRAVTPIWLGTDTGERSWCGLPALLWNRVEVPGPGELRFRGVSATRAVTAHARCDPRTLAGYVYRDPGGWDVHVAQSDVGSCAVELFARPHPLAGWRPAGRLSSPHTAALEFHAREPLPGVRYIPWDATHA